MTDAVLDLEYLYRIYPRKIGKKIGLKKLKSIIKSKEIYNNVKLAIENYREYCKYHKIELKFTKHFNTFVGCWEDWTEIPQEENNFNIEDIL